MNIARLPDYNRQIATPIVTDTYERAKQIISFKDIVGTADECRDSPEYLLGVL